MKHLKMLIVGLAGVCCFSGWIMHFVLQDTCQTCFWLRILWSAVFIFSVLSYVRPFFEKGGAMALCVVSYVSFQKASFSFFKGAPVTVAYYNLVGEGTFCQTPNILHIPLPTWSFFVSVLCLFLILTHFFKNRRAPFAH